MKIKGKFYIMKKNICHYYADIYQTNKDDKNKVKVASKEFIEKNKNKSKI